MDINKYRMAYHTQKSHAAHRGIGFNLTFQQWCEFWGEDIERRGNGPDNLQMQRCADTGPYELGNIRKGTPKQNSATYQCMRAKRLTDQAAVDLQIALDAMMNEPSLPPHDEQLTDDRKELFKLGLKSSKQLFSYRYYD